MIMRDMTFRQLGGAYNVKADWTEIDRLVASVIENDKNKIVTSIGFLEDSIIDGVLEKDVTLIAVCENFSAKLHDSIEYERICLEKSDRIPGKLVVLWER